MSLFHATKLKYYFKYQMLYINYVSFSKQRSRIKWKYKNLFVSIT